MRLEQIIKNVQKENKILSEFISCRDMVALKIIAKRISGNAQFIIDLQDIIENTQEKSLAK